MSVHKLKKKEHGMTSGQLMACHDCDLLQRIPPVPEGSAAFCRRCGTVLVQNKPKSFQRPLALLLAGVILFVMFNAFPFLTFKKEGLEHRTHVVTGIRSSPIRVWKRWPPSWRST
jgi:paraquat-inducible protein A